VNFVDLSSLSLILGKNIVYLLLGILLFIILIIALLISCSFFFRKILASQPWIIIFLRLINEVLLNILYIPITTILITTFDCYNITSINETGE
jgi:hypothetical protein